MSLSKCLKYLILRDLLPENYSTGVLKSSDPASWSRGMKRGAFNSYHRCGDGSMLGGGGFSVGVGDQCHPSILRNLGSYLSVATQFYTNPYFDSLVTQKFIF